MFHPFHEQYIMHRRQDDFYNHHLLFQLIQKDARAQHTPYYRMIAMINYPGVGYFNLDESPEKFTEYLQMF